MDAEALTHVALACDEVTRALEALGSPDRARCPMETQLKIALKNLRKAEKHLRKGEE